MTQTASLYRPRLTVYVLWHPECEQAEELADRLYSDLCRDAQQPTARGISIPVFFRCVAWRGQTLPPEIRLDDSQHTAGVALIDPKMVNSEEWPEYVAGLWRQMQVAGCPHRLFPVSLSSSAYNLHEEISATNFVRLHEVDRTHQPEWLVNSITHELCRLLLNQPRIALAGESAPTAISAAPVSLFISHAKKDGLEIATAIRDYVNQKLALKTFFDANDIAPGVIFYNEIDANIERSALLIVHTDAYASRQWCQHEVLWAKRYDRPVVVVHAIKEGESRCFPYGGNVPAIRWDDAARERRCEMAVGLLLREVLRYEYFKQHFEDIRHLYGLAENVRALPHPPELLTALLLRTQQPGISLFIYPDPPLGAEELRVLREFNPDFKLGTLTMLPTIEGALK
jgi:hypothetical protein